MVTNGDEGYRTSKLTLLELPVTPALTQLLKPGDRRFIALTWNHGLDIYDGWIEYTLDTCLLSDIFGDGRDFATIFEAHNSQHGCGAVYILIDFVYKQVWCGDETDVEDFLENVVNEKHHHSVLFTALEVGLCNKLDGKRSIGV